MSSAASSSAAGAGQSDKVSEPAEGERTGAEPTRSLGAGTLAALASYLLWGGMPLYFAALAPAGPFEVVGWRILFSLVLCAIVLTILRAWRAVSRIARQPRTLLALGAAGAFIYVNWTVFVLAALTGHVVESSLGYFINPIVTVLLGVLVLRERLRPAEWAAVGISLVAVLVIAVGYGVFPWISLVLAVSFGLYGFIKNRVGARVDALSGLTLETAWLAPVAIVQLLVVQALGGLSIGGSGPSHAVLLALAGPVTAAPLLLFAAAARRIPLTVLGLTQYLTPVLQLIVGVVLLHEAMTTGRWIGFGLVWLALIVLTVDRTVRVRRARRSARMPAERAASTSVERPLPEGA